MNRISIICLLILSACVVSFGQVFRCGTTEELAAEIIPRLKENKALVQSNKLIYPRSTVFVPIKFHLVAKSDGTGRVAEKDVLNQLCLINEDFSPQNIQFYLKGGFNYINNNVLYASHYQDGSRTFNQNDDNNALNVFIVDNANNSATRDDLVLGYYTTSNDWIVIRRDAVASSSYIGYTLAHEIGHFFSLLHPFNGWDSEPYDPAKHGVPVQKSSPGFIPTEKVDGSNCEDAGDMVCDTPPNYNFGWPNCKYEGGAQDPDGKLVDPDENLFMSYFPCLRKDYYFSEQQMELIMADLMSRNRANLRVTNPGNTDTISEIPKLVSPVNGNSTQGPKNILLEWTAVAGANQYLVEVSTLPNFPDNNLESFISNTNTLEIPELDANKLYFWRVKPFNEYFTCQGFSGFSNFRTTITTGVASLKSITKWSIFPNPVSGGQFQVNLNSENSFEANISLINILGKTVVNFGNYPIRTGENNINLTVNPSVSSGIYFLQVSSREGQKTERLAIHF